MAKVFDPMCSISTYMMISFFMLPVAISLFWNISSEYIVFGKDILLNCDGITCTSKSTKMWIGGPQNDLIFFNFTSSNPSKYEMIVQKNNPSFGLKIKNLTIGDVNCKYTCACGLQQYTKMLDLLTVKYIYPPQIYVYSYLHKEDSCNVDIMMEVYPLPRCFIVHESTENRKMPNSGKEVNLTSVLKTYSVFNASRSTIFNLVRIRHSLHNMMHGGNLYLRCSFDSVDTSDFYHNLSICQQDPKDSTKITTNDVHVSIIVIAVTGCFLLLGIGCVCTYIFVNRH